MHLTEFRIVRNPPQVSFLSRIAVSVYAQGKNLYCKIINFRGTFNFVYFVGKQQGFFSSEFGSVIRTQSQCQIVSFFPKLGPKIPNLLQTAKVKTLSMIECVMDKFQKTRSEEWL